MGRFLRHARLLAMGGFCTERRGGNLKRIASLTFVAVCVLALTFGVVAGSAAPSRTWTNDFENPGDDTPAGDWYPNPPATITRTPSGAAATYASGIQSASGNWHARLGPNAVCPKVQASFLCSGPYTFWGKGNSFNPAFPDGGYVTEIDIYLDVSWMAADPANRYDTRFDWDSSIDDQFGGFRRDFVFNAGTPLTVAETGTSPGYYVNASTNAFRSGAFPQNPCPNPSTAPNYCRAPVKITQSGWYIFQHYFHLTTIGGNTYLAVDMSVRRLNGSIVASWTIYDQEDAAGFGGDAYGWFVINEIQDLAADCSALHPPGKTPSGLSCPQPAPSRATGGGQIALTGGGRGTFGFNVRQQNGIASGHLNYLKTGVHLDCTVSAVTELTTTTAKFSGTCSANSSAGSFMAEVEDNGESGAGTDHFKITYNLTTEGNTIARGNIQIG
jgi:hypothetical protein